MLVTLEIPEAWFNDELSVDICEQCGARVIPAVDWITYDDLLQLPGLPKDFNLDLYIVHRKVHAILFRDDNEQAIRIHPDRIIELVTRELQKIITQE